MRLYKSFLEIRDEEQKNFTHSAEFQLTAEVEEDEIMQGMSRAYFKNYTIQSVREQIFECRP